MNKSKFFMYAAAFAAIPGVMTSCSEDDTTGTSLFDMKPLTVTLNAVGGDDASSAAKPNRVHSVVQENAFMNYWSADDAIYAWSSEESFLNKLSSVDATRDKASKSFSGSTCKYEDGKRMALVYVGNQKLTTEDGSFTLTRSENGNDMALVYGIGNDHYSDRTNPFVLKVSSSAAKEGKFTGSAAELTLKDAIAKLRIGLPAKDADDAAKLAKLKYVISVSYTDDESNSGFPEELSFEIKSLKNLKQSTAYKIFDTDSYSKEWGSALTLTYDPSSTDEAAKPSVLWNTTDNASADYLKGYVYVPLPAGYYSALNVTVTVSNPNNVEGMSDFCKDYTYKWEQGTSTAVEVELNGSSTNQYFYLPDMWTRE